MKGFTLLEVMIALAIMAGVVLTVISSFNYHLSVVDRDREETVAVLLARTKMDDPAFVPVDKEEGSFAPARPDISWKTEITSLEGLPGVRMMTFTVSWNAGKRNIYLVNYQR